MTTNKQTLRIPRRESHDWCQSVMHHCDFCGQFHTTVTTKDGEHICASCCDAEYVTALTCALEVAIERMEAAERRNAELHDLLFAEVSSWTQRYDCANSRREAAEKRIAELEAREVNLPKRSVGEVMHMSGFSRDYAEGWCSGNDNALNEIKSAGITTKGE